MHPYITKATPEPGLEKQTLTNRQRRPGTLLRVDRYGSRSIDHRTARITTGLGLEFLFFLLLDLSNEDLIQRSCLNWFLLFFLNGLALQGLTI
jgi:hypothetical protein